LPRHTRDIGPIDDLGFVDLVTRVIGGRQAGGVADRAVDIRDGTAGPAHDVVVVVPDPRLVARDGARRLDAPHQARGSQRAQHIVNGLVGHLTEILAYDIDDGGSVRVRMFVHRGQHRYPRTRHTQSSPTQHALEVRPRWHIPSVAQFLDSIKYGHSGCGRCSMDIEPMVPW